MTSKQKMQSNENAAQPLTQQTTEQDNLRPFREYQQTTQVTFEPTATVLLPVKDTADADEILAHHAKKQASIGTLLRPKKLSRLAKLALSGLLAAVVVQTGLGLADAWTQSPWLFGFYSTVIGVVLLWTGGITLAEWRQLKKLKQMEDDRVIGARLLGSMQMGEALPFIRGITASMPSSAVAEIRALEAALSPEQNDAEQVRLFDTIVLRQRDQAAKKIVRHFAAESALLLAISPFAVLDMALVLWRNQKMISQIAESYGIKLGYWSRIRLFRGIVLNILYAGTTELAMDIGNQLLSVELTGKLSARLGQGLGAGLLTARLGYQAMALCRPLAFDDKQRPRLSGIHKELLQELQQLRQKAKQATEDNEVS
ncbi:TIGR01620 family protein [Shewanella sp. A32]|uniref:TIGR01620 family protein n=1 Tax=Shewanella sp. A32 TaxID=3031327 RepID=UPI0023B926BB|nr:TIGR01620 family protein [Shewanella sp. A32]MDF0533567.1 TIGR01620 family protein [Shewanella sp. A32]